MEENSTDTLSLHFGDDTVVWAINNRLARPYVPAMVFVGAIFLVGVPGNGLVLYVYHFVFRTTTANLCIYFMALVHVTCLCLGAPVELLDMRFPVVYGHVVTCSVLRTIELNAGLASGFMMLCVTYDRYNHICKPLHVFTVRKMRRIIIGIAVVSTMLTAPLFVLFGPQSMVYAGIATKGCSFDDRVKDTMYPFVYFTFLAVLTIVSFVAIIALDVMIIVAIRRWQRNTIGEQVGATRVYTVASSEVQMTKFMKSRPGEPQKIKTSNGEVSDAEFSNCGGPRCDVEYSHICAYLRIPFKFLWIKCGRQTEVASTTTRTGAGTGPCGAGLAPKSGLARRKAMRKTRTTRILCVVSCVFVVTYLPYLLTQISVNAGLVVIEELPFVGQQLWELANKSYFISTATNPLIYAALNPLFRTECLKLFTHLRITSRH